MKSRLSISAAQGLLIRIARIAWAMYASFVGKFSAFNATYTEGYGADALKEIETTAAIPSEKKVAAALTGLLNKTRAAALICTDYWQNLSAYIEATFAPADREAARKEAGSALYSSAANENWTSLLSLLGQMTLFITDNIDILTKDGKGMPPAFPELVAAAKARCIEALQAYAVACENAKLQTAARQAAYKSIQTKLMAMLKDAKQIFKRNPAILQTFTFAAIKRSLSPEKTGISISIKDENNIAVTTSHLTMQGGKIFAQGNANAKGIIDLTILPGTYTLTITTPGYETKVFTNVHISSGGTKRIKATLKQAVAMAMAQ